MIPGKGDLHDYWRDISTDGDFLGPPSSYTLIRDPVLRLCHRMMAHSIAGRSQAPEKVTVTDLFYLRGLDVRSFIARLAEHFGLLDAEILGGLTVIAPELPIIDMAELVRLQIYVQFDDTWAWVAMGPERQPDAAAGALAEAEDVLISGCSKWTTCGWKDDGYCNGGNLPEAYIIGNQLHYQNYEWYEALEDCKLKDEALRNKAIMEGSIKEDDDESRYEQKRQWNTYTNYDDAYEINHEHNKSKELCEVHEQPMCNIRRYMMIKYSFNDDEEYVAVKEEEYDDLTVTRKEACRAY
ncbi:hypothetical protein Tco_0154465 [Tanacetum coccineum]